MPQTESPVENRAR